jgi:hypothetical protein
MSRWHTNEHAQVTVKISKSELMSALADITIHCPHFDSDFWSIGDAEDLETMSRMIRREIFLKNNVPVAQ